MDASFKQTTDDLPFERVRSLTEVVHDHLRATILSGSLAPGDALRQEQIASELGVSRAPVREALMWLEKEGLILLRPRRGFVVASLDCDEIQDIFEIREMLEGYAGYLAAQQRTEEDVAALAELVESMAKITSSDPAAIAQWASLNRAFHARLFDASGRKHLCRMTFLLRDSVERYVRLDGAILGRSVETDDEHRQILEAFRAGDAELLQRLCREHCQHTCARLLAGLKARRG